MQGEDSRILCRFLISRLSSGSDEDRSYKFHRRKGFAWKKEFPKGVRGYPGSQRLVRLPVSIKSLEWPARHCCAWLRPAADAEAFRRTRRTTSWTLGRQRPMANLVILQKDKKRILRAAKNSVRLNLSNLFDITDKSAIFFKDLSA